MSGSDLEAFMQITTSIIGVGIVTLAIWFFLRFRKRG